MSIPKYRLVLWTAFAAALLFFIFQMGLLPGTSRRAGQRFAPPGPRSFALLDRVMTHIRDDYLDQRDPVQTAEGAFRGMLNSLDSLSCYLSRDLTARYLGRSRQDAAPGLVLYKKYGMFPQVAGMIPGSPAEKAGVLVGDVLTAVGHRNTLTMSLTEIDLLLRGGASEALALKFLRGGETLELTVERVRLFAKPWSFENEAGRPPMLKVHEFAPSLTAGITKELLPRLKTVKGPLVVDLRNCAGGDLDEAVSFVNLFLKAQSIGAFGKEAGGTVDVACPAEAPLAATPLVVWVDQATMGPAELVAGALQEVRKAKIVGLPTPGLVARTELFSLQDESAILLTSAVFALPSGRVLWNTGLTPDAAVPAGDRSEKAFLEKTLRLISKL
jgi:carboxyl-terminal processing protease